MKIFKSLFILMLASFSLFVPSGCENKFEDLEVSPNWLGPNIYDYLVAKGNYSYFIKLIDDCGYKETMQRTGSVTLFVADDAAFARFFASNKLGVTSYEDMPQSIKYLIIRSGLLTNAYTIERLCDTDGGGEGQILRRNTTLQVTDFIPYVSGNDMPANSNWSRMKDRNFLLLQDGTQWTMVHFIEKGLKSKGITNSDFEFISGKTRVKNDAFIYNDKVIERDIACKNGYIHVMQELLVPPSNMAQYIKSQSQVSQFRDLMDRFSAPYFYGYLVNSETNERDSIFELRYLNSGARPLSKLPDAKFTANGNTADATLLFDPGWNKIQTASGNSSLFAYDMPAMFVPTNDAMNTYFSATGLGNDLWEEFKTWDKVPNTIAADFVSNHMKKSFLTAMPSQFGNMKDESGYLMDVTTSNIVSSYISRNGLVYTINKVLPPLDYRTVLGPVKVNSTTSIFQKAQSESYVQFIYYFRSLLNTYNYFATLDVNMNNYRDPVSQGYTTANKETWKFQVSTTGSIQVVAYRAGGDSVIYTDLGRINNRLQDIFDQQTIVGDLTQGQEYYITKGGAAVRVLGNISVAANGQKMFDEGTTLEGGGNIERGTKVTVKKNYAKENGCTYFVDGIVENPVTSVFGVLQNNPKFSKFFELLNQADFFSSLVGSTSKALNYKIKFFDLYHYTIYVPTNDAIDAALAGGLIPTQTQIDNATTVEEKEALVEKRYKFLRYHFQDNSIFIKGKEVENQAYLSSAINDVTGKFYPLYVTNTNGQLKVKSYYGETANVIQDDGCYNIMARDIVMNNAALTSATQISTSSWAVIHLIDKVLRFE